MVGDDLPVVAANRQVCPPISEICFEKRYIREFVLIRVYPCPSVVEKNVKGQLYQTFSGVSDGLEACSCTSSSTGLLPGRHLNTFWKNMLFGMYSNSPSSPR